MGIEAGVFFDSAIWEYIMRLFFSLSEAGL